MSGVIDAGVIVAVVALVVVQQFRPQKVLSAGRKWWAVPAVLVVVAAREPGMVDAGHRAMSVGLLVAGVAAGLATGAAWAWTTRIWTDASGAVWAQGTKAAVAIWAGGLVLRLGLSGIGALTGVHQGTSATLLTLAAMLLARTGIVVLRARRVLPSYGVVAGG
ncbi:DUF1453 domain-containing protein [Streptomyces huiliensis]|uniref:DUF1453 domain-containing protein n=1 Tax=Streptomyces huiliensis TaxID=2876027 RepID=UPI001CBFB03C|nr:DUF1453 domain-containing protein [Streptomyces huiliensis]MBZ4320406.1 DUF1453 domain-containing protein [Streptomyces huiliensis]